MKVRLDVLFRIMVAGGVILIAIGCAPVVETTPTPVVTAPVVVTMEPISYEPVAGTTVGWVDASYVVFVPAGDFLMGQDETQPSDHAPAHTVNLDGFWIHQTEVTNRMYAQCVALGICTAPYRETGEPYRYANSAFVDAPVVGVDWVQAETYCEWIDGRLPTEAEWEKAARGTEGKPYPWGDAEPACSLLNYDGDCFDPLSPVDVRSYFDGASPYELADTAGNVMEWVYDWFDEAYYSASPARNPTGPGESDQRVVRGSSYESLAEAVPVYLRSAMKPQEHNAEVGFRCVLSGETMGNPPPPFCEAPAYSPPAVDTGEAIEPVIPSVEATAYCLMGDEGMPHGYINLVFSVAVETDTYFITSTAGAVTVSQDPAHPDTLILSGPGIPIGTVFELTLCPALPAPPQPITEPLCPAGYTFDTASGVCRYLELAPGEACGENQVWLEGFGCIWAADDPFEQINMYGICAMSPGYEIVELSESPSVLACLPVDGPQDCEGDQNCSLVTECMPGTTYMADLDCCAKPPEIDPVCMAGYTYDASQMLCIPEYTGEQCRSFYVFIQSCAPVSCSNPGQYGDESSCVAAHCRWVPLVAAQPYCTYP